MSAVSPTLALPESYPLFEPEAPRRLTTDAAVCGPGSTFSSLKDAQLDQLYNSLYTNVVIFAVLIILFEANRHIKLIYLKRANKKFIREKRVPPIPPRFPFGWIWEISKISDDSLLAMVGLDAYMFLRYVNVCYRCSVFMTLWGICCLAPIYSKYGETKSGWGEFTLSNLPTPLPNEPVNAYWTPVVFMYVFSAYFCYLMFSEYKRFVNKRVDYLARGDPDTPPQTYYTLMIEKVPSALRSETHLRQFFDNIFPGEVYSVEVALDLNELDEIVHKRREARNGLEKAVAISHAIGRPPTKWVPMSEKIILEALKSRHQSTIAEFFGYVVVDSIEYHTFMLNTLNTSVRELQDVFNEQRKKLDSNDWHHHTDEAGLGERGLIEKSAAGAIEVVRNQFKSVKVKVPFRKGKKPLRADDDTAAASERAASENGEPKSIEGGTDLEASLVSDHSNNYLKDSASTSSSLRRDITTAGAKIVNVASSGLEGLAKEGMKTARIATTGALRGVLEATRALELLTLGAYYKTSTTAFVTLNSRVANGTAHQMLLSHRFFTMEVNQAPNPKDIIWDNVSIPKKQLNLRHSIADATLVIGALFWSVVVTSITSIGNISTLSQEYPILQQYSDSVIFKINSYLVSGLLLILLSLLPYVFDFIARNYEGLKVESEIQNSIMTRYFYYQLANVFVSMGMGSLVTCVQAIVDQPSSVFSIVGESLPFLSFYFTSLIITKTFTALALEFLRVGPLFQILSVLLCLDRKKCTRRELLTGAYADPPMLYGWCYPNIMMVLMIMLTYACIAPMILPFCCVFFLFALLMYKYQLLYVYVNEYQSGGYMWYAVFSRSMVCLLWAVATMICYLAINQTFYSGPVYVMLPLPVGIILFWYQCDDMFAGPSLKLSLESAIELDKRMESRRTQGSHIAHETFRATLFRQPSLAEEALTPMPYRPTTRFSEVGSGDLSESGSRFSSVGSVEESQGDSAVDCPTSSVLQARTQPLLKDMSYVDYYVDNYDAIAALEKSNVEETIAEAGELLKGNTTAHHVSMYPLAEVHNPLTQAMSSTAAAAALHESNNATSGPAGKSKERAPIIVEMNRASYGATEMSP